MTDSTIIQPVAPVEPPGRARPYTAHAEPCPGPVTYSDPGYVLVYDEHGRIRYLVVNPSVHRSWYA